MEAGAFAGDGEVLAGGAPADEVNVGKRGEVAGSDIIIFWDRWPMGSED